MLRYAVPMLAAALVGAAVTARQPTPNEPLRHPSDFSGIADRQARSVAIFREMGKVILSPRCQNCHPRTDSPTQTDAIIPHRPPVVRGTDGHGAAGLECTTCHGPHNVDFSSGSGSIPGNPLWHLAPRELAWQGFSLGHICRQIRDPARNGGKSLARLVGHNAHDPLVGWAWHPGRGRMPAPGTQAQFGALTAAWIDSGAACP
jgi:hypothetical protein